MIEILSLILRVLDTRLTDKRYDGCVKTASEPIEKYGPQHYTVGSVFSTKETADSSVRSIPQVSK